GSRSLVTALLEIDALEKRFGGVTAVDGCSFAVAPRTITGLIGPNGSGKTTVFNLVTGYLAADAGSVRFDGRPVRRPDPTRLARQLREQHAHGLTFRIVEPNMSLVMRLCDPVIVLDHGTKLAEGRPAEIQSDPRVLDAYLGT